MLNNLESKHSLLMEFGQFMSYYKRKKIIKEFCKILRSDIWLCDKLKFDYLKNEKSFGSEKKHFSLFLKCSLLVI